MQETRFQTLGSYWGQYLSLVDFEIGIVEDVGIETDLASLGMTGDRERLNGLFGKILSSLRSLSAQGFGGSLGQVDPSVRFLQGQVSSET
jgi:hypothetical protein